MVASAFKTISCVARCSIRQIPSSSMSMDTLTITVTFVGNGLVLISSMLENKVAFVYPSSNVATKCGSEILTDCKNTPPTIFWNYEHWMHILDNYGFQKDMLKTAMIWCSSVEQVLPLCNGAYPSVGNRDLVPNTCIPVSEARSGNLSQNICWQGNSCEDDAMWNSMETVKWWG